MVDPNGESVHDRVATTTLSLDRVFDVLSNRRRRFALYHLNDQQDGVAAIPDIAETVAHRERDYGIDETATMDSIAVELLHVHLPKLEQAGIVDIDRRSQAVRYYRQPSLEEWLEHAFHVELAEP